MLEYIFECIKNNKTSDSYNAEFVTTDIGLNKFTYESLVSNDCHVLLKNYMSFNGVAAVTVGKNDYRIHFWYMTKIEAVNRLKNADLIEKDGQP